MPIPYDSYRYADIGTRRRHWSRTIRSTCEARRAPGTGSISPTHGARRFINGTARSRTRVTEPSSPVRLLVNQIECASDHEFEVYITATESCLLVHALIKSLGAGGWAGCQGLVYHRSINCKALARARKLKRGSLSIIKLKLANANWITSSSSGVSLAYTRYSNPDCACACAVPMFEQCHVSLRKACVASEESRRCTCGLVWAGVTHYLCMHNTS
jgi:hypothetical protein